MMNRQRCTPILAVVCFSVYKVDIAAPNIRNLTESIHLKTKFYSVARLHRPYYTVFNLYIPRIFKRFSGLYRYSIILIFYKNMVNQNIACSYKIHTIAACCTSKLSNIFNRHIVTAVERHMPVSKLWEHRSVNIYSVRHI